MRVIINKVTSRKQFKYIRDYLNERDIRWLGMLEASEDVALANLMGGDLVTSDMQEAMNVITRLMLDEAEMPYVK